MVGVEFITSLTCFYTLEDLKLLGGDDLSIGISRVIVALSSEQITSGDESPFQDEISQLRKKL